MSDSLELVKILAERSKEQKNMLENLANVGKGVQGAAQELSSGYQDYYAKLNNNELYSRFMTTLSSIFKSSAEANQRNLAKHYVELEKVNNPSWFSRMFTKVKNFIAKKRLESTFSPIQYGDNVKQAIARRAAKARFYANGEKAKENLIASMNKSVFTRPVSALKTFLNGAKEVAHNHPKTAVAIGGSLATLAAYYVENNRKKTALEAPLVEEAKTTAPAAPAELELACEQVVETKAPVLPAFKATVKEHVSKPAPASGSATPFRDLRRARRAMRV